MAASQNNPWKNVVIFGGVAFVAFLAAGGVIAYLQDDAGESETAAEQTAQPSASAPAVSAGQPPQRIIEDCNRYAAEADRDGKEIAKDGLLGAVAGAGLGAAAGAIADGGSGAGKGAGIGAIVGGAGGTLYGFNKENQRTEAARAAYRECMARNGY